MMKRRLLVGRLAAAALVVTAGGAVPVHAGAAGDAGACVRRPVPPAYAERVRRAVTSGTDVWGKQLLAAPGGPTYASAHSFLAPLLLAKGPKGRPLTDSGVYYLPFGRPSGAAGAATVALHVADGSQVVSRRVGGPALTVSVGAEGRERYGSCLARLATPALADGYLPILDTRYVDGHGVVYHQESFATRIPQTNALVSLVRVTADARTAGADVRLRFDPSPAGLRRVGDGLQRDGDTELLFSRGGRLDGTSVVYEVAAGSRATVYVAWLTDAAPAGKLTLDGRAYDALRRSTAAYWRSYLSRGAQFVVPERRVLDAERSVLVQDLLLTWRYSVGNPYEEFSFPESVDVAQVLGSYGFADVGHAILRTSLSRRPTPYPNWKMGEKLVGSALQFRLFADRSYVEEATPVLAGYVDELGRQVKRGSRGILERERFSSDIADSVFGLHSQAVAWQGLSAMARVWAATGRGALAARSLAVARRLEAGLRTAVRDSERRLRDGSLFLPARLLDGERPYDSVTASRPGSYWNLVIPYALASGLFAPGSAEARGALGYLDRHGARLLGLVRAAAFALYGQPVFPTSGTDEVYGTNAARFLADNDLPDRLVSSLYGQLGAAMTDGTFVSGEAASITPLHDEYERSMYLPPNAASNAAFLETLRLMLVHESRDRSGVPSGLELAYATPRAWLAPGRRIVVQGAPTSFGPVSFSLSAQSGSVRAVVRVPQRRTPPRLGLRLRLPRGERIVGVSLGGRPYSRFDPTTQTIDLGGLKGTLRLVVAYRGR